VSSPDAPTPWQTQAPTASSRLLPPGLVFADTWSRVAALFLDGFVIAPITYVLLPLVGMDPNSFAIDRFPERSSFVLASAGTVVIYAIYFVWFWSGGRRATPGQRLFGIQVANAFDGVPLTFGQAFGRWTAFGYWVGVVAVLPFLSVAIVLVIGGSLWSLTLLVSTIISSTKQGLHDRFAASAVVRPAGASNRWAVRFVGLLVVLVVIEGLFVLWSFTGEPSQFMPPNFMDRYLHWLWPS